MQSGKLLWKRNINRAFGWNDYFYLNDSTLMVVAAGLHTINIKTGEGWDYNTPTGKQLNVTPNSTVIAGSVMGGIFGGLIGGVIGGVIGGLVAAPISDYNAIKTGDNVISGIVSNTVIRNDFIYFAFKDTLAKLNKHTGQIAWKTSFEKDITGNSFIFLNEDVIYMINNGLAFRGQNQIDYGKPFIVAFDARTGREKYFYLLNKNDGSVIDFKLIDNEIYLLHKNAVGKYDMESGRQISGVTFQRTMIGDLDYFVDDQFSILNKNESFLFIDQYDLSTIQIHTTTHKIITLDAQLSLLHTIDDENIGVYYAHYQAYDLIAHNNKTFIVNDEGEKIAELKVGSNAIIINNILYDKLFRSFIAIDLQNVIPK